MNPNTDTFASPVDVAAERAAKRALLAAQLAAIEAEEKVEKEKLIAEISAKIDAMPELLGVKSLDEVIVLVRQRNKGQLGALDGAANEAIRSRTVLTPEQRAQVIVDFKAQMQRSAIVTKWNISASTLQNILKENGLVTERGERAAAA